MVRKSYTPEERTDVRNTRLQEAHARLDAGVAELLADGSAWRHWLDVQARMHRYSFNNVVLIMSQCPEASLIFGFRDWSKYGRSVRKGERAIWILAPFTGKRDEQDAGGNETTRKFTYFRPVPVFDVLQTEGDALEQPPAPIPLEGDSAEL